MRLTRPEHVHKYLAGRISREVEEFWTIALNADKRVIGSACLFRGSVDFCPFHPREVFRFAYLQNAASLLVAHNHPSGNPRPSLADVQITQRLLRASGFLEIPVLDHIIVCDHSYYSFLQSGKLNELKAFLRQSVDHFIDVNLSGSGDPMHSNDS